MSFRFATIEDTADPATLYSVEFFGTETLNRVDLRAGHISKQCLDATPFRLPTSGQGRHPSYKVYCVDFDLVRLADSNFDVNSFDLVFGTTLIHVFQKLGVTRLPLMVNAINAARYVRSVRGGSRPFVRVGEALRTERI
jgi:hypothetical protein